MTLCSAGQRTRTVKLSGKPLKKPSIRLPWPRCAEDDPNIHLGVDVQKKRDDIIKITHRFFKVYEVPMEELLQEIYLAIIHKNYTRSAHDPRKSSFGHYVFMVANNVCINLVHRKKRYDKERESIDSPQGHDDQRTLLELADVAILEEEDTFADQMEELEAVARQKGMWDCARYIRAARSGSSPLVIREALTWGDRKVSSKNIRDIRMQVRNMLLTIQTG